MKLPNLPADRILVTVPDGKSTDGWYLFFDGLVRWIKGNGGTIYGTHAQRVTVDTRGFVSVGSVADGTVFVETDRQDLVYQLQGGGWRYVAGTYQRTQAQLSALAATLTASDTGLLVEVTDYRHILRWTASLAWEPGPGEVLGGYIQPFAVDPDPTTGWQLCDGTTVAYLKKDGTTANFATPDLTSAANKAAYLKLGTPVGGPTAATAPGGTVSAIAATATAAMTSAVAAGQNTASNAHTHPAPTVTIDATGEPRNYELRPFFRR